MYNVGPKNDNKNLYGLVSEAKNVHLSCQTQIALLDVEEVSITIPAKYLDYTNVFFLNSVAKLHEPTSAPLFFMYKKDSSF